MVARVTEEHLSLKRLWADLLMLHPTEPTFEPKFKIMKRQAERHHDAEESHLFPQVRASMSDDQLESLGLELLDLQQRLRRAGCPRDALVEQIEQAASLCG